MCAFFRLFVSYVVVWPEGDEVRKRGGVSRDVIVGMKQAKRSLFCLLRRVARPGMIAACLTFLSLEASRS